MPTGRPEKGAAEATAAAMEEAEKKIQRETAPGGSRVNIVRKGFHMDPASRMKIDLDGEDSRSSEDSCPAIRPCRNRKEKTPDRQQRAPERHPHNSDSFVTCSNGDGRDRQHRQEPTRCKVGVPGACGRKGHHTPVSPAGEVPSRESNPG